MSGRKGRRMETKCYQTFPGYYPDMSEKQGTNLNLSRTYRSEKRLLDLLGKDMEHINSFCCQGKIWAGHALVLSQLRLPGLLLVLQNTHRAHRAVALPALSVTKPHSHSAKGTQTKGRQQLKYRCGTAFNLRYSCSLVLPSTNVCINFTEFCNTEEWMQTA